MRCSLWLVLLVLVLPTAFARGDLAPDALDKAPSRFAMSGDLKVHYKSLGEGNSAVVFIHGWCCDHTVWRAQAAALNGKVRQVFVDLPGYGKSDKPKIEYTMDVFAKGVDAVLRDAGVEHAVLAGHSMGTPVVRQFYRQFPGKTKALVFVDGALKFFTKDSGETEKFMSRFKEETFAETAPRMLVGMLGPNTPAAVREQVERLVTSTSPQVAISSMRGMVDQKVWKEDPVKVPSLALMAKSPIWTVEYKDFAKKLVPDLQYLEFEGVGHFLFMEKPNEINVALTEFLKKQGMIK
jgi:pimeloyl-ACP methyl ester carboxylesterase